MTGACPACSGPATATPACRSARAAAGQSSPEASLRAGWRSYRLCGVLLVTVSLSMLGVAALIVREGNGFRYEGYWIFAVALYDFYCLISALVFLIRSPGGRR